MSHERLAKAGSGADGIAWPEPKDSCSLCQELEGFDWLQDARIAEFLKKNAPTGRAVHCDEHFVVVPSLGPLVPGHVMIVPRRHFLSVAEYPPNVIDRFIAIYGSVWRFLEAELGHCTAFEHGCMPGDLRGGACVNHAHTHLLPFGDDVSNDLRVLGQPEAIGDLRDLSFCFEHRLPYLFYENRSHLKRVWTVEVIQSQLMRTIISSRSCSPGGWDWRDDFRPHTFRKTLELFAHFSAEARLSYVS